MNREIVISIKTILFFFLFALGIYVLYRLGPVLGIFSVALLIAFAMEPLIKRLMQGTVLNKKVPRGAAVLLSYSLLILVLVVIFTIWLPPFLNESQKLIKNLPKIISGINLGLGENVPLNLADFAPEATKVSGSFFTAVKAIFNNITGLFSLLIIALYLSMDWPNLKKRFAALFPDKAEELALETLEEVETSLGHWVKGQAVLMLFVGLITFVGLILLDIDYPLALGLISGFLEIVPMLGPILSAVIAIVIALADSPIKALGVLFLFILIQQFENNILVPKVMQKVSGFSPLIILFALLVGSEFFGLAGAVFAVPMAMIIGIIFKKYSRFIR